MSRSLVFGILIAAVGLWRFTVTAHPEVELRTNSVDLGEVRPGEVIHPSIQLRHKGAEVVSLIGIESGCTCISSSELPTALELNDLTEHRFDLLTPTEPGEFSVDVVLLLDCGVLQRVALSFSGSVLEAESKPFVGPKPDPMFSESPESEDSVSPL